MTTKIHWSTITVTNGERDFRAGFSTARRALEEYRRDGTMDGYWPCSLAELPDGDNLADAGIDRDAIDFEGIDR